MSDYDDDESVPQGTYRVVRDGDKIMVGVMCNGEEIMVPVNHFTFEEKKVILNAVVAALTPEQVDKFLPVLKAIVRCGDIPTGLQ